MTTLDHGPDLSTHPEFNQPPKKSRKGLFMGLGGGAVALVTTGAVLLAGGSKGGGSAHEGGPTPNRTTTSAPANPSTSVEVTSPAPHTSASSSPETSTTPEQGGKLANTLLASTPKEQLASEFGKLLKQGILNGDKHFIDSLFDPHKPLNSQDDELTGYETLADQMQINIQQVGKEQADANIGTVECSWAHYNSDGQTGLAIVERDQPDGTRVVGGVMKCTIGAGGEVKSYYRAVAFANNGHNEQGQKVWVRRGEGVNVDPYVVDPNNINSGSLVYIK